MTQEERIKKFTEEYGKLVKEYEVDYATYPVFVPDGQGGFKVVVQASPVDMMEKKDEEFIAKN